MDDIITMSIKEKKREKIKIQGTGGEKKFGGCGTFFRGGRKTRACPGPAKPGQAQPRLAGLKPGQHGWA